MRMDIRVRGLEEPTVVTAMLINRCAFIFEFHSRKAPRKR